MAKFLQSTLEKIETEIREGSELSAKHALEHLDLSQVPRQDMLTVAELGRRAGLPALSVRLLNPLVRPTGKQDADATAEEKAEYAAALTYIGANEEALGILRGLNPKEVPKALLFEAFARFAQWDYAGAISPLKKYVTIPSLNPYQKMVGKVNLAAALVHERKMEKADYLLKEILHDTSIRKWSLLYGNTLQLAAEHFIWAGKYSKAESLLAEARKTLKQNGTINMFYVRRWEVVLDILRSKNDSEYETAVKDLREEALTLLHWETLRDLDKYQALHRGDEQLLTHLYYGTPYEAFRQRLLGDWAKSYSPPKSYLWEIGGRQGTRKITDLFSGEDVVPGVKLKVGQNLHRLLGVLCSDFYRPARAATLHQRVFPQEFFNPISSAGKIHELLWRLRKLFKDADIPLGIVEDQGFYRLTAASPSCVLLLPLDLSIIGKKNLGLMNQVKEKWPSTPFSAKQVGELLKLSPRTTLRMLQKAEEDGVLGRAGMARATKYFFNVEDQGLN